MAQKHYENGVYRSRDVRILDRSGDRRLPIGDDGFESVARRSMFVDKSMLMADVVDGNSKVTLFCRPRRFGKTLAMTMLRAFFEIAPDGESRAPLFEGLAVWDAKDGAYRGRQGAYPVVYISLNDVKRATWDDCYRALCDKVAAEYERHGFLREGDALSVTERESFERIAGRRASGAEAASSLRQLCLYLSRYHGRGVVVLIDEYDAPIMAAQTHGYYGEAATFMKGWLTGALKDGGAALEFACLTGVQRIAKESIFSDLNNLIVDTSLNRHFDECFGFTREEVAALADYLGHAGKQAELGEWYDGYRFGNADIYNPWSVLNYFGNDCEPGVYWVNTASNAVVAEAVRSSDESLQGVFDLLEPGGAVWRPLDMGATFPESGCAGDALWSMLYLAGYLTTDDVAEPTDAYRLRPLRIPNREIARVFRGEVIERFRDMTGGSQRLNALHTALVAGDADALAAELSRILATCPSCRAMVGENSYHMFALGLMFGVPGYGDPRSNREEGRGYFDVRLTPDPAADRMPMRRAALPVVTLEFKVLPKSRAVDEPAESRRRLSALAADGLAQIAARAYDGEAEGPALRYGIAFSGKDVAVACERR